MVPTFTNGTSQQQQLVLDAVAECTFPLAQLGTTVNFTFGTDIAGHGGKFEAVTDLTQLPTHAEVTVQQDLDNPASPLYFGLAFFKECIIHELGHVVILQLGEADQRAIATAFGLNYDTQWTVAEAGGIWTNAGSESAAETFKDLFLTKPNRRYDNRTAHQLPQANETVFCTTCWKVFPPGGNTEYQDATLTTTYQSDGGMEYGTDEWFAAYGDSPLGNALAPVDANGTQGYLPKPQPSGGYGTLFVRAAKAVLSLPALGDAGWQCDSVEYWGTTEYEAADTLGYPMFFVVPGSGPADLRSPNVHMDGDGRADDVGGASRATTINLDGVDYGRSVSISSPTADPQFVEYLVPDGFGGFTTMTDTVDPAYPHRSPWIVSSPAAMPATYSGYTAVGRPVFTGLHGGIDPSGTSSSLNDGTAAGPNLAHRQIVGPITLQADWTIIVVSTVINDVAQTLTDVSFVAHLSNVIPLAPAVIIPPWPYGPPTALPPGSILAVGVQSGVVRGKMQRILGT